MNRDKVLGHRSAVKRTVKSLSTLARSNTQTPDGLENFGWCSGDLQSLEMLSLRLLAVVMC